MKLKPSFYWRCQLAGWLLYGLLMTLTVLLNDNKPTGIFFPRVLTVILWGIFTTHLFRKGVHRFGLRPPFPVTHWWGLLLMSIALVFFFCLGTSLLAEGLKLYNPASKVSAGKRFFTNLLLDSPLIFIWISAYYIFHYAKNQSNTERETQHLLAQIDTLTFQGPSSGI